MRLRRRPDVTQFDRTDRGLGAVRDPELVDDAFDVRFDGADADVQGLSDLGIRLPPGYQAEHFELTRRQRLTVPHRRLILRVASQSADELGGEPWVQWRLAA